MVRKTLGKSIGERGRYTGIFVRFGKKRAFKGHKPFLTTVLIVDVTNNEGKLVTDHLWFNFTKRIRQLWENNDLKSGTILEFDGRVVPYTKRIRDGNGDYIESEITVDYKLSHPTQFGVVGINEKYDGEDCGIPFEIGWEKQQSNPIESKIVMQEIHLIQNKEQKKKQRSTIQMQLF
jgi:hypothetical protein